jgi:hypothetical protein
VPPMRNRDFMSDGFLALIAAGLVLLCSILLGTYLKRSPTEGGLTLQFHVALASTALCSQVDRTSDAGRVL